MRRRETGKAGRVAAALLLAGFANLACAGPEATEVWQLHLEWQAPLPATGDGQGRGNSGVFLQQRYEVQVLDSYQNRTYSNGQAASIYKQHIPLVNATTAPGTWQTSGCARSATDFLNNKAFLTEIAVDWRPSNEL
jgi:hypothetical protein